MPPIVAARPKPIRSSTNFISVSAPVAHSAFLYHYARVTEIVFALERIEALLHDPQILDTHVRATAGVDALEGA